MCNFINGAFTERAFHCNLIFLAVRGFGAVAFIHRHRMKSVGSTLGIRYLQLGNCYNITVGRYIR